MNSPLQDVKVLEVVTLERGRVLGTVDQVLLDMEKKVVTGIIAKESIFRGDRHTIAVDRIKKVGIDVVLVDREDEGDEKPQGCSLRGLRGLNVETDDGNALGRLEDIEIDENWRVVRLILSENLAVNITPEGTVFGEETVVVEKKFASLMQYDADKHPGFLTRLFGLNGNSGRREDELS